MTTVEDEIRIKTNGKYSLVSKKYKNANTPIEVKHHECGKTYKVAMHNFRKGRRCPHCNLSIGEQLIINILQKKEIDNIKRNYAYDNGYNLIEIPYTLRKQEDISKFLFKELKELF